MMAEVEMPQEKKNNQSRSEVAYQKLLQAIRHGELTPGTRVREIEIAEKLGISRTPVRDAIRRLESDGLLNHIPRQGAVIKQLEQKEVIELYEVREVLEGTAARYAARHASEIELAELEDLNDLMLSHAESPIKVAEANRLFHQALYRAANNRYLVGALNSLSNALTFLAGPPYKSMTERKQPMRNIKRLLMRFD
ncbi:transcriptional regulator GntR family [Vibrio astriarenae]|nr:transcriptional regulator GntR family [Vibrio sp. C7]